MCLGIDSSGVHDLQDAVIPTANACSEALCLPMTLVLLLMLVYNPRCMSQGVILACIGTVLQQSSCSKPSTSAG